LAGVIERLAALEAIPEFAVFPARDLEHAASKYPTRSEAFLREGLAALERLQADARFVDIPEGVVRMAAVWYPDRSHQFLQRYLELDAELAASEFADVGPQALRAAKVNYHRNPYAYLKKVRTRLDALAGEPLAADFPQWELQRLAAIHDDAAAVVREAFDRR
jgi:hypothetical protein